MRYSLASLALAAFASAADIDIDVGKSSPPSFSPSTTTANVGDTLVFHFYSTNFAPHSVVSTTFDNPCKPGPNALFSGLIGGSSSGGPTFSVNVTSTDPIWYYCSNTFHCSEGMVGVVNPPSGQTMSEFAAAAVKISEASAPSNTAVAGGVIGTVASGAGGSATSAASSTSAGSSTTGSGTSSASSVSSGASSAASSAASAASSGASSSSSKAGAEQTAQAKVGAMAAVAGGFFALMI